MDLGRLGKKRRDRAWTEERRAVEARAARDEAETLRIVHASVCGANMARALMRGDERGGLGWRKYLDHLYADGDQQTVTDRALRRLVAELVNDPLQIQTASDTIAFADRWLTVTAEPEPAWAFAGAMRRRAVDFGDEPRLALTD